MAQYIDIKIKQLNDIISKHSNEKIRQSKLNELNQLKKCKGCEWGTDTGVSVLCIRVKCVK